MPTTGIGFIDPLPATTLLSCGAVNGKQNVEGTKASAAKASGEERRAIGANEVIGVRFI
jgi:hypothetical protein